jgi:hypothetical protein
MEKRRREQLRKQKQQDKEQRRAQRANQRRTNPKPEGGADPDLEGLVPGPQPTPTDQAQ